jgi:NAD(P)-dependent dehydrogenase (short-subunit alcohol dehydrogenase family)
MSNPVVLITGALTGIGRAAAVAFAKEGARLVVAGRREDAGRQLAAELRALGTEAEFVRADVRHEDDVRDLIDRTVARFGCLDVAVNAAGTEGKLGAVTEQTAEAYAATFDTNVLGTVLSMKHELRIMRAQGAGSIINISSTYGHQGARVPRSMRRASTPWRARPSPQPSRRRSRQYAAMRWRQDRRTPACLTVSPVLPKERRD